MINLEQMTVLELKALAYDTAGRIGALQSDLQKVERKINEKMWNELNQPKPNLTGGSTHKPEEPKPKPVEATESGVSEVKE
jgi:hypothetical protein